MTETHDTTEVTENEAGGGVRIQVKPETTRITMKVKSPCDCPKPRENFPYDEETFDLIKTIAPMILRYSEEYDVPPVAVAGSIADEYNTRTGPKGAFDWFQDEVLLNWMPNFFIEFDVFIGIDHKILNATKHDIGLGNIKLETAKEIYDQYPSAFEKHGWDYSDLVDYIRSDQGTVHIAALVIAKAKELLEEETQGYPDPKKEAVLVTYYKQGDKYIERFKQAEAGDPSHRIKPGEGCRVCLQRKRLLEALGIEE